MVVGDVGWGAPFTEHPVRVAEVEVESYPKSGESVTCYMISITSTRKAEYAIQEIGIL